MFDWLRYGSYKIGQIPGEVLLRSYALFYDSTIQVQTQSHTRQSNKSANITLWVGECTPWNSIHLRIFVCACSASIHFREDTIRLHSSLSKIHDHDLYIWFPNQSSLPSLNTEERDGEFWNDAFASQTSDNRKGTKYHEDHTMPPMAGNYLKTKACKTLSIYKSARTQS